MEIRIGADAVGRDGKLGEVRRVVVEPRVDRVVDLVIQQDGLLAPERVLPVAFVLGVQDEVVDLDLDKAGFETMVEYSPDAYRGRDTHYSAPPAAAYQGDTPMDFQMDRLAADGALGYTSDKPGGYPGGEQIVAEDRKPAVISRGTDVFDAAGEKIGEIGKFGVDLSSGKPTYVTVLRGFLFPDETELPLDIVRDLHHTGLTLSISGAELDARMRRRGGAAA